MDPFPPDPDDQYAHFRKFVKKGEYKKAYRCLENLIREIPGDAELLNQIVSLCLFEMDDPGRARPWLYRLTRLRSHWRDRAVLGQVEAHLGDIDKAREHFHAATAMEKKQRTPAAAKENAKVLDMVGTDIEEAVFRRDVKARLGQMAAAGEPRRKAADRRTALRGPRGTGPTPAPARPVQAPAPPPAPETKTPPPAPSLSLPRRFEPFDVQAAVGLLARSSELADSRLRIDYHGLSLQRGFEELVCIGALNGVERYWYQVETAKRAIRQFKGRVLLCDEVGLGKSVEAGMIVKEYLLRGMATSVLVLAPAPLVSQWKEEMSEKFGLEFSTTDDAAFQADAAAFWKRDLIIASIHTAKRERHLPAVTARTFDIVVVDEAHHLKNRGSLAWKLVNEMKKRFLLLLTATPVQNNLVELFNLITLLKPGQFKTERLFRDEYMQRGDQRTPKNKEKLRELLRDVMIRNTRSAIDLKLPKRFASTLRLEPGQAEREIYDGVSALVRGLSASLPPHMARLLMREAGSSPFALGKTLRGLDPHPGFDAGPILRAIDSLGGIAKGEALLDLVGRNPDERKLVFVQYLSSMDYVTDLLAEHGVPFGVYRGDLTAHDKDAAIGRFRDGTPVLVSTESGGEGRNLQFCNTIVNFDLPWNPMRIEQRIGRLHRIGQKRDVFIFNLSVRGTVEDHVLELLDKKINMFEMVIGEIEPILGYLGDEREFEEIVMDLWLKSRDGNEAGTAFQELGVQLASAKAFYLRSQELDRAVFGEEFEV